MRTELVPPSLIYCFASLSLLLYVIPLLQPLVSEALQGNVSACASLSLAWTSYIGYVAAQIGESDDDLVEIAVQVCVSVSLCVCLCVLYFVRVRVCCVWGAWTSYIRYVTAQIGESDDDLGEIAVQVCVDYYLLAGLCLLVRARY